MKQAIILHGLNGFSQENWFPWLKRELEKGKWQVWVPTLPYAEKPSSNRWSDYVLRNAPFALNDQTYLIGHSAGTTAVLALLQKLPKEITVDSCVLVAPLKDDLALPALKELFDTTLDFTKIKQQAKRFVVIQSDDDPYMSVDHGSYIAEQVSGELIIRHGEKHFSTSTVGEAFTKFPFLLELIKKRAR